MTDKATSLVEALESCLHYLEERARHPGIDHEAMHLLEMVETALAARGRTDGGSEI